MKSTRPTKAPAAQRSDAMSIPERAPRRLHLPSRSLIIIGGVVVALVVITALFFARQALTKAATETSPQYQTILPKGESASDLGGWKLISPPKSDPVFAYTDTIDGVTVSISQQPLPKSFVEDVDGQVSELAKKFNATTRLSAGSTVVFIGTSSKGPQSVIFTKNNLLILMKSEGNIKDASWTKYILSLQ